MQQIDGRFVYGASDLTNYLECVYLTQLDRDVAQGLRAAAERDDPSTELLARKGNEHERHYLDSLTRSGGEIAAFERPGHSLEAIEQAQRESIAAMERGDRIIYQATFFDGEFLGHPDFLRRIQTPCERWPWSYEIIDTKLAINPKPYFIIQICNYSEQLARISGTMPEFASIVLGNGEERRYRLADYLPYYRRLKQRFLQAQGASGQLYPHKVTHCKICKWSATCQAIRENDDHLSQVAWIRRSQIERLNAGGITTVAGLAAAGDDRRPTGMSPQTFGKLRRQASLQVRGRSNGPSYELIEHRSWEGFGLMPQPAAGDVFFDMEGDPLFEPGRGLEYLFGCWLPGDREPYKAFWGTTRAQEKRAFEEFVDFIMARRARYPQMHVYHYADYERSALRRLAQAHATREQEVDDLLRGEVLVDLFAVVRQSLVISESSYSIKRLERFYPLERVTSVKKGDDSIVMFERWLEEPERHEILDDIEKYNRDDCRSTELLRDWLLERRREAIAQFGEIPFHERRLLCHEEPVKGCKTCDNRVRASREAARTTEQQTKLLSGILTPQTHAEYAGMQSEQRARYLLANLLAYHRREEKPVWWAFFDRCENPDTLLEFDKDALAGLDLDRSFEPYRAKPGDRNLVYTYRFPEQHHKVAEGDNVSDPATGKSAGKIVRLDDDRNLVALKRSGTLEQAAKVGAIIPSGPIDTAPQQASLTRIADRLLDKTLAGATLDLLMARAPSLNGSPGDVQPPDVNAASVSRAVQALAGSYLFIQGPPGSGKSTVAAHAICDLLQTGKRVGVLSTGHKAIHHLLHKVEACARERRFRFDGLYKYSESSSDSQYRSELDDPMIRATSDNEEIEASDCGLIGGTAWLFSREGMTGALDYLFVDEAGQVSLADAVAVSACARNIVLLGDPSQLAQVSQGAHPLHAGDSVLEHLLAGRRTIPPDRGIFLDVTYRMHPEICGFLSASMYDGRLDAWERTQRQRIESAHLHGSGLRYVPMQHEGNSRESREEADWIAAEIARLLEGTLTDCDGHTRKILPRDVIVVTPYNAQRRLISRVLRDAGIDVAVGTVDKFQGQEAYVVFYSMATSSGSDLPRDIDFLFDRNRFNVAVSRARALAVLVASERLADIPCTSVEQIAVLSLMCSFIERAQPLACTPAIRQSVPQTSI